MAEEEEVPGRGRVFSKAAAGEVCRLVQAAAGTRSGGRIPLYRVVQDALQPGWGREGLQRTAAASAALAALQQRQDLTAWRGRLAATMGLHETEAARDSFFQNRWRDLKRARTTRRAGYENKGKPGTARRAASSRLVQPSAGGNTTVETPHSRNTHGRPVWRTDVERLRLADVEAMGDGARMEELAHTDLLKGFEEKATLAAVAQLLEVEERGERIQGAFGALQKHSLLQKAGGAAAFVPSDLRFWVVEQQWQRLKAGVLNGVVPGLSTNRASTCLVSMEGGQVVARLLSWQQAVWCMEGQEGRYRNKPGTVTEAQFIGLLGQGIHQMCGRAIVRLVLRLMEEGGHSSRSTARWKLGTAYSGMGCFAAAAHIELGDRMEYVFAVDCWQVARDAHDFYWGGKVGAFPKWADQPETVAELAALGQVDIWQCSLKCHLFSTLGGRSGPGEPRLQLEDVERWLREAFDTLQYLKLATPRAAVIENVPQLRTALRGEVWGAFRKLLAACGGSYKWRHVETCPKLYGSCFRRRRLWIIGIRQAVESSCMVS